MIALVAIGFTTRLPLALSSTSFPRIFLAPSQPVVLGDSMASRNLTNEFKLLRTQHNQDRPVRRQHSPADLSAPSHSLISHSNSNNNSSSGNNPVEAARNWWTRLRKGKHQQLNDSAAADIEMGALHHKSAEQDLPPPIWLEILDLVREDLEVIKQRMARLIDLHKSRTTMVIGKDEAKEEQEIEIQTLEIKRLFQNCETNLNKLGEKYPKETKEEMMIRINAQKALVIQIHALSLEFRSHQRVYLQRVREMKIKTKTMTGLDDDVFIDDDDNEGTMPVNTAAFTDVQLHAVSMNEQMIMQRDKELREIMASITDLQDLFKDLSQMVIEQGTILDNIEYNVQEVVQHTETAVEELKTANKYQKTARGWICAIILVVVIVGLIAAIIGKIILKTQFNL